MKRFVLDASVSLALFLDDPVPDLAMRVQRSFDKEWKAVVPSLWRLEVANGFASAERRRALTAELVDRCLEDIEDLMASVIEESASTVSLRQAVTVARSYRLTAYDAAYLETARIEHLPLATLDRALAQAAARAGVELFH